MKIKDQIDLYNAAVNIVNFCYDENGCWIGTEKIKADWKFINLVSKLVDVLEVIQPTMDEFVEDKNEIN